jgi:hypothetical protein
MMYQTMRDDKNGQENKDEQETRDDGKIKKDLQVNQNDTAVGQSHISLIDGRIGVLESAFLDFRHLWVNLYHWMRVDVANPFIQLSRAPILDRVDACCSINEIPLIIFAPYTLKSGLLEHSV